MKVALNTDGKYTTQAGTARYIRGLTSALAALNPSGDEFFELAWPVENYSYQQPQRSLKTLYREWIWAKWIAPAEIARRSPDLLHSMAGWFIEPPGRVKTVCTLHDLALIRFPARFRRWQRWAGVRRLRELHRADRIICISRFTADEAIELLGLPASKLEVVHNGCDFQPGGPLPPESKPDADLPSEFFLFVGSLEPGKNLALLKETYRLAEQSNLPLPPLVIVGARWEGVPGEGAPPANWHYLGRQDDAALVYLYRRAIALVFPSIYEGFGLPVIEAMALGTPVICSPVSSIKEIGGEAARFVDLDPAAYGRAMRQLAGNRSERDGLASAGRSWAGRFSWRRCAEETLAVYRSV